MEIEPTLPDQQNWIKFVEQNEANASGRSLTEDDVERLVTEVRAENRQVRARHCPLATS